jgi:hypothetical protein
MKNQAIFAYAHWHSVVICLLVVAVARLLWVRVRHLRSVPGPLLAKFTPLYRIWTAATGKQFIIHQKLHEAYGPIVRIGPNHVSVSDAASITDIYGIASKFYKVSCHSITLEDRFPTNVNHIDVNKERFLQPFRCPHQIWIDANCFLSPRQYLPSTTEAPSSECILYDIAR